MSQRLFFLMAARSLTFGNAVDVLARPELAQGAPALDDEDQQFVGWNGCLTSSICCFIGNGTSLSSIRPLEVAPPMSSRDISPILLPKGVSHSNTLTARHSR